MSSVAYKPYLLERLQDPEYASLYLNEVLQHESPETFLIALRHVVEARGFTFSELANRIGLTRQGLTKALSGEGNPRLSTLRDLLGALGMRIRIEGLDRISA